MSSESEHPSVFEASESNAEHLLRQSRITCTRDSLLSLANVDTERRLRSSTTITGVFLRTFMCLAADGRTCYEDDSLYSANEDKIEYLTPDVLVLSSGVFAHINCMLDYVKSYLTEKAQTKVNLALVSGALDMFRKTGKDAHKWDSSALFCGYEGNQPWILVMDKESMIHPIPVPTYGCMFWGDGSGGKYARAYTIENLEFGSTIDDCLEKLEEGVAVAAFLDSGTGGYIQKAVIQPWETKIWDEKVHIMNVVKNRYENVKTNIEKGFLLVSTMAAYEHEKELDLQVKMDDWFRADLEQHDKEFVYPNDAIHMHILAVQGKTIIRVLLPCDAMEEKVASCFRDFTRFSLSENPKYELLKVTQAAIEEVTALLEPLDSVQL